MRLNRLSLPTACSIRADPCREFSERRRVCLWCWIDTGLPGIFRAGGRPRGLIGIVALVTERGARIDTGADVEQRFEVTAVAGLTTGEMKCDGQAAEIGLQMNLG